MRLPWCHRVTLWKMLLLCLYCAMDCIIAALTNTFLSKGTCRPTHACCSTHDHASATCDATAQDVAGTEGKTLQSCSRGRLEGCTGSSLSSSTKGSNRGCKGGAVAGLHTPPCPSQVCICQLGAARNTAGEAAAATLCPCKHTSGIRQWQAAI